MIEIDGSFGEGGGQVVRTSLSLSAITGEPVRITNVRANRSKPGLLRQHLTALNAIAEICGGRCVGAELGSSEISLYPGSIKPGEYAFSVGSAGSANLVLQTVLPVLLHAKVPSKVTVQGGTHNPASPPADFLLECFLPALKKLGHQAEGNLSAYGFYPAGGGELSVDVCGGAPSDRVDWRERGPELSRQLEVVLSNIPGDVAKRELKTASEGLDMDLDANCKFSYPKSAGPGNALIGRLNYDLGTVMFVEFGEKGVTAEQVAKRLVKQMKSFIASGAAVDHHLADQLMLPLALAKGGVFTTTRPSLHSRTNADVIHRFTGKAIRFEEAGVAWLCDVD